MYENEFLTDLYNESDLDVAIDKILEKMDHLCCECHDKDDFSDIDKILLEVDLDRLSITCWISFLMCACWVKDKIQYQTFYDSIKQKLIEKESEERVVNLLEGF